MGDFTQVRKGENKDCPCFSSLGLSPPKAINLNFMIPGNNQCFIQRVTMSILLMSICVAFNNAKNLIFNENGSHR